MTRQRRSQRYPATNFFAIMIACCALAVIHVNSDPMAVGESPLELAHNNAPPLLSIPPTPELPEPVMAPGDPKGIAPVASTQPVDDPTVLRGIWALKMTSELLNKGIKSFGTVTDYTANMYKQERMNGELSEGSNIDLKVKHQPFSVYMKWQSGADRGQQAIFVEDQNEGNLLVQPGGIKGRLTGVLTLDPEGTLAMASSRHPVTQIGLLKLAEKILDFQKEDLERGHGFKCELLDNATFGERPCYIFTCVYESEEYNQHYRKSVIYVDKELSMPVCVKNFCWAKDANPETIDDETLLEFYAYTELELMQKLETADFDATNRKYRMRVRR